tara:strand:+ start:434 stop:904 length:471 start_codon:yes stop_codon:yes gene_type:complete
MILKRTYLGVDPGTTTGLAVLRITGNGWVAAHDQITGPHDAAYWIRSHCEGQFIELVYETFYIGGRTLKAANKGVFDTLSLVGWITIECAEWIGTRLYPQSPSEGKTIKTEPLKNMGLYNPSMRHASDAMRHVVRHHLNEHPDGVVAKAYVEQIKK